MTKMTKMQRLTCNAVHSECILPRLKWTEILPHEDFMSEINVIYSVKREQQIQLLVYLGFIV